MRPHQGLTLMELLCCLAIVGLLAACAVPTHRYAMQRTRRTDARIALFQVASLQERHYFQQGRYADSLGDLGDANTLSLSSDGFYRVTMNARIGGQAFIARATPVPEGPQARDVDCRALSLDDTGRRSAEGAADADRRCWN